MPPSGPGRLPSQPTLLDRDPLFAQPAAPPDDEQALRQRVLDAAVEVLRASGPLTARDIAKRLAQGDARIDRRLVNSVLHREGAAVVRYDAARYTYSVRRPQRG